MYMVDFYISTPQYDFFNKKFSLRVLYLNGMLGLLLLEGQMIHTTEGMMEPFMSHTLPKMVLLKENSGK